MEEFSNQSRIDFLELYVDIAAIENVLLPVRSVDLNSPRLPSLSAARASPDASASEGDEGAEMGASQIPIFHRPVVAQMPQLHDVVSAPLGIHHEGDEAVIPFWEGISHYSYIDWSYRSEQESCTDGSVSGSCSIQGPWGFPWRVRAMKLVFGENWKIMRWGGKHNCLNEHISQGHRQLNADVIADLVIGMIKEEPSVSISLVQERITSKYGFKVSYRKAWYTKQKAMVIMYEQTLVTGKKVFHRIFWTFTQCCEAFKFAKPVIQIDGTHLYGKYKGKLLVATAQDGNDECLPIAFAIVEGETLDAWDFFLVNIRAHVTDMSNICLISDRHRSIISVVEKNPNWQPPNAYHVFCIRHIASNFNQKFQNEGLKRMLKNLGYTLAMVDFERNLASFRESIPQIAE
ncbi:uncharacterized protein LOC133304133 [Gastrolobium bilobum]|uniref:uncharacterized protein LOC133304133 n=1 Tax=Gastrolobium bilobum TaxID=150636 RepID=UPI002AAF7B31|nr:uncharacterized protein LOC133304133 [Gastrolobium bilobum]